MVIYLQQIVEISKKIWQGKGFDTSEILSLTGEIAQMIMKGACTAAEEGKVFPLDYLLAAMSHLEECVKTKDEYKMADCLYFEWREIMIVYLEFVEM